METWFEYLLTDELLLYVFPVFLMAIAVEVYLSRVRDADHYDFAETRTSFCLMMVAAVVEFVPRQAAIVLMVFLHEISPLRDVVGRQWWAWLALLLLDDLAFYWWHRASHEIRLLWAGHVNHHSARVLNLSTAIRAGVGERLTKMAFWLWLPLLGFDVGMILVIMTVNLCYQFWLHTPLIEHLPEPIEAVFNTPSHHRVHHASNVRYLDANHGGILIVWDRLFGTFVREQQQEPCVYGITTSIAPGNLRAAVLHEYIALSNDVRRAATFKKRLQHLFGPPGWRGTGATAASTKRHHADSLFQAASSRTV